ncbi:MAG: ribosome-recycling factor [Patescibacteria group bacterium]|nr:ribosome-recycling factor [Patescibacteria group bacterium]
MELIEKTGGEFDSLIEEFRGDLSSVRTNRPTPKLIEDIPVSYLDQKMLVKQLGSIGIEPPRDLVVNVWDQNAVASIAKGIREADLGVGVSEQGKTVRVTLPDLTEERKEELVKVVKGMAEEIRIKMRRLRDEAQKEVKEDKDEDAVFKGKERLQGLVDKFNQQIDELVDRKTKEVLE